MHSTSPAHTPRLTSASHTSGFSLAAAMTTMVHRGSLPFIHARERSLSIVAKPETMHDSMFVPNSHNFLTRLRARKQSTHQNTITPVEAAWFLSLPDKVRRQHFTKEEQILIRAKSELALLSTAPQALHHAEEVHPPHPRERTHSVACDDGKPRSRDPRVARPEAPSIGGPHHARLSMVRSKSQDTRASAVSHDNFSIPNYASSPTTFLRSPTIKDVAWDSTTIRNPPSPDLGPQAVSNATKTASIRAEPPPPIHISKALYVRDPSTKLFLRDCVSKGRFEETLNFGFPINNTFGLGLTAPLPHSDGVSPGTETRLNWLDAPESPEDSSDLSSADEVLPDLAEGLFPDKHSRSHSQVSMDRRVSSTRGSSPARSRLNSNASVFEDLMKRDMTLRMTLTKPELRASEDDLYGWQEGIKEETAEDVDEKDPLALQELRFSDDSSGLTGAFANSGRKKSIWSRK